jgi:hypothetical protein
MIISFYLIKTNFLGVTIDTENGSSNPKIRKALDKSFKLLDIMEFIKVTKFKLNNFSRGLCPHDAQRAEWPARRPKGGVARTTPKGRSGK